MNSKQNYSGCERKRSGVLYSRHTLAILFILSLLVVVSGCFSLQSNTVKEDYAQYVNPIIGAVRGSGSTYPGAQVPFGMVSFSPHTEDRNHGSGYHYTNDKIRGFGMVHISGVGCEALCEMPFMPVTGDLEANPVTDKNAYSSTYSHDNETASAGYYQVLLDRYNIDVALTATTRSAMAKYTFADSDPAHVIFQPTASANGMRDGQITIDPDQQKMTGWVRGGGFCHIKNNDYTIYYTICFDKPFTDFGIWKGDDKNVGLGEASGNDISAYVSFGDSAEQVVTMKTGISFVSLENAEENLNTEIPAWNFNAVKLAARNDWNKLLNKVQVEGGTVDEKTMFYTALYHSVLTPNIFDDVNGQYPGMDNKIYTVKAGHHVYATFSGWDTYRTQAQLWGLLFPQAGSDFCQTFLDTSRQTEYKGGGGLPLWSMLNDETLIMSGYPASPFIANAYAFGARDFEVYDLAKVMIDSGKNSRYWGRNNFMTWSHLDDYKKYGYYPDDCGIHSAISQNVEYAVADFSIAQMSLAIGDEANYTYFLNRSHSVFNLMHPTEKYLWARLKDGTFKKDFDPFTGAGCQEGTSTHYTWGIPQNLGRLIGEIGGDEVAEARLDKLMSDIAMGYDYGNPKYLAGNEPCFGIVPVYNWMQRPWKTQNQMRRVMNASFTNKYNGIPGDDDSGAMSAWYVFAAMGLYPEIPGVGGLAVTGPLFPKMTLNLDNGKTIVISANGAANDAPYIQSMSLNGDDCQKTWLTVEELTAKNNTVLDFTMSAEPNKDWAKDYRPPSFDAK